MARILICHVPKDGSLARDLGAALMGRGHFVSFDGEPDTPRADRLQRLRQFEAVAVLWTETSAPSAGLCEIARETMPLNLLVSIRAEELDLTRLPLAYRKLHMLAPRDIDGIARIVARLSAAAVSLREIAERETVRKAEPAAAPHPRAAVRPPPSVAREQASRAASRATLPDLPPVFDRAAAPPVRPLTGLPEVGADPRETAAQLSDAVRRLQASEPPLDAGMPPERMQVDESTIAVMTASELAVAVDAGLLEHHIPASMWLGTPSTVEITLGREMLIGLAGGASIETISVSLYGNAEAFEIERQSERTQFIAPRHGETMRDRSTYGRWVWLVTPRALGPQDLVVRVGALLRDHHGVPGPVAVPDRRYTIEIELPQGQSLASALAGWRPR